jgi:hypothetical protein
MTMTASAWRTAAAASASAFLMIGLGVPATPVFLGVCLALGLTWWRSRGSH